MVEFPEPAILRGAFGAPALGVRNTPKELFNFALGSLWIPPGSLRTAHRLFDWIVGLSRLRSRFTAIPIDSRGSSLRFFLSFSSAGQSWSV